MEGGREEGRRERKGGRDRTGERYGEGQGSAKFNENQVGMTEFRCRNRDLMALLKVGCMHTDVALFGCH